MQITVRDEAAMRKNGGVFGLQGQNNSDSENPLPIDMDIDPEGDEKDQQEENENNDNAQNKPRDQSNNHKNPQNSGIKKSAGPGFQSASLLPADISPELPAVGGNAVPLARVHELVSGSAASDSQPNFLVVTEPEEQLMLEANKLQLCHRMAAAPDAPSPCKPAKNFVTPPPKQNAQQPGTPTRSSKRSAATADQNSLERASRLKARMNLDSYEDKGVIFSSAKNSMALAVEGIRRGDQHREAKSVPLEDLGNKRGSGSLVADEDLAKTEGGDFSAVNILCSDIAEGFSEEEGDLSDLRSPRLKKKQKFRFKKKKGRDFLWHCKPPVGWSGGMLMGINLLTFDTGEIEEGDFFIKFKVRNKVDDFRWLLVSIYGPAQQENKEAFLLELAHLCSKETLPMVVGGDFNILRGPNEKNNSNYNDRWPFLFNAVIDACNLQELEMSGRRYTWANNLPVQTFEKLNRVLMCIEWELKFPRATVQALTREISDHTPLFLNSGDTSTSGNPPLFKFELGWLLRDGFFDMVRNIWVSTNSGQTALERWQNKIRRLRQHLRGWEKHVSGCYKKEKKQILNKLDELDKKSEDAQLENDELNLKHALSERLACLLREEELKWYQRAKENEILIEKFSEDEVRKAIFQMEHNKAPGPDGFPPEFYQVFWTTLFEEFHVRTLNLHSLNFGTIIMLPKSSEAKQIQQYRPICLLNVSFKIFTKVATNRLTQISHRVIRPSQTAFLPGRNIMVGAVILHETLHELHKKKRNDIVFKIDFEKAYNNVRWDFLQQTLRMKGFLAKWCSWVQSFVQPGNVGVKVNDQVGSYFQTKKGVHQGYPEARERWKLEEAVRAGSPEPYPPKSADPGTPEAEPPVEASNSLSRRQDDDLRDTTRGEREGRVSSLGLDLLLISRGCYNIVVDMLAIMINRAKDAGQIEGLIPHLVQDGLSILQYADDTVIFLEHDIERAKNLKLLLCAFEQLSGLKINFHKSEIFYFGQAKQQEEAYSHLFGCSLGSFPFRYLGIPMHFRKLSNKDWALVEDRFEKRLSGWKGKLLSVGGRLVLINSVLSSLPMFMLSFFEVPKGVLQKMDYYRSRFYWQNEYRLARWEILCQPKNQGGLGILILELQNKCLLSKWLFKLCNEDGVWQQLIRNKYLKNKTLSQVEKRLGDSHYWSGLMEIKGQFLNLGSFTLKNGTQIRFWEG
ncbi:hypothetical protein U9M48_003922 [Paspalum notatum var. saurae]|uniref:Reverse transcriptase domain-containing protein n=1 Tax=Paspalum notatum var. saurae TaxID=547442 RepID=A0AAQ3SL06_PASNO